MGKKDEEVEKLRQEIVQLNQACQALKFENFRLTTKIRLDEEFYAQQRNLYTAAATDLLFFPNPVKIHGIYKNRGLDFMVEVMNVVLIKSKAREKIIYLKKPVSAAEGGPEHAMISTNGKFDELIYLIQEKGNHLVRVSKSCAVNIRYYKLKEPGTFILSIENASGIIERKIKTDKTFDLESYLEILNELAILSRYKNG